MLAPPRIAVLAFALALVLAGTAGAEDAIHLRRVEIVDAQGFGQPVLALTFLAPAEWRLEGGVNWRTDWRCVTEMVSVHARAVSAEGARAFEIFPAYASEWDEDPMNRETRLMGLQQGFKGCPVAPPFVTRDFIAALLVPGFRPGAEVADMIPDAAAAEAAYEKVMREMGPVLHQMQAQLSADAARARIRYRDAAGEAEEWIAATTFSTAAPTPSASAAMQGGMAMQTSVTTYADNVYGFRAPAGALDGHARLFAAMLASVRFNPAWQAAVTATIVEINRTVIVEAGKRAQIWHDAMTEIGETQMQSWQHSQQTLDRVASSWSHAIRGTAPYVDPATNSTVALMDGYDSVWSNGQDEYLLATDPGFDPNTVQAIGGTWRRMERAQ